MGQKVNPISMRLESIVLGIQDGMLGKMNIAN